MNDKEQILLNLVADINELAFNLGGDTSRYALVERIDKMMWTVTWAINDYFDYEDKAVTLQREIAYAEKFAQILAEIDNAQA